MRPISIDIEGFTSFRELTRVDFSKLDLFAITGPTGAGKTSIIDAMIYALYGCTPRIGEKSIVRLISQGAPRLKVLLEFSSANVRYRISRELPRGRTTSLRFEKNEGGAWIPLADTVTKAKPIVEKVVGLNFSGFTKSVVLPQGEFDRFLKGKPEDRRQILTDLLQLDIYERMMRGANQLAKECKSKADFFEAQLSKEYVNATPERLEALRAEMEQLRPLLEPLDREIERVTNWLPSALQLRQARSELTGSEAELKKIGPSLKEAEQRLEESRRQVKECQARLDQITAKLQVNSYNSGLHTKFAAALPKATQLQELVKAIADLERLLAQRSGESLKKDQESRALKKACETATKNRSEFQKSHESDRKRLEMTLRKYGTPDAIKAAIDYNKQRLKHEGVQDKIERDLSRAADQLKEHERELRELDRAISTWKKKLDDARNDLDALKRRHAAEEIKEILKKGQACPVCEQEVDRLPKARKHPSVDQAGRAVAEVENELNGRVKRKANLEGQTGQIEDRMKDKRAQLADTERAIVEASAKVEAVLGKKPGSTADQELAALREEIQALQKTAEKAAQELETLKQTEVHAANAAKDHQHQLDILKSQIADNASELDKKRTQQTILAKELGELSEVRAIKSELAKQEAALQERDNLSRKKDFESSNLSSLKDEAAKGESGLAQLISRRQFLEQSSQENRKKLESLRSSLAAAFGDLKVDEAAVSRDAAEQLMRRNEKLRNERQNVHSDIVKREEQVRALEKQIARAQEIKLELGNYRARQAVAHELALLLEGDQFIAFIQQEAYERLASDGSAHLTILSSDRYSFDVDGDDFVVRDHWNADEPRPVTTLSGGETFLASLALALALAEGLSGLSSGRGKFTLESLFLDEGFGTLDSETLDVVLQGVENLSTNDRLIGIVSHLTELAERMPARIQVQKSVGGSSLQLSS